MLSGDALDSERWPPAIAASRAECRHPSRARVLGLQTDNVSAQEAAEARDGTANLGLVPASAAPTNGGMLAPGMPGGAQMMPAHLAANMPGGGAPGGSGAPQMMQYAWVSVPQVCWLASIGRGVALSAAPLAVVYACSALAAHLGSAPRERHCPLLTFWHLRASHTRAGSCGAGHQHADDGAGHVARDDDAAAGGHAANGYAAGPNGPRDAGAPPPAHLPVS